MVRSLVEYDGRRPFSVHRIRMKPGASHPPLRHAKTFEFFLVLNGSMRAKIGAVSRRFKQGDFASLPAGCSHEFRAGDDGVEVLVAFSPGMNLNKPDIVLAETAEGS